VLRQRDDTAEDNNGSPLLMSHELNVECIPDILASPLVIPNPHPVAEQVFHVCLAADYLEDAVKA